jgi:hypothetical protein
MKTSLPSRKALANESGELPEHIAMPMQDVRDAAFRIGRTFPGGLPALAQRMGLPYSTLQKKLSPNDESRLLAVDEAVAIQVVAQRYDVLYAMAWSLNHVAVPLPADVSRDGLGMALANIGKEVGDVFRVAQEVLADGDVSPNERRKITAEVSEVIAVLGAFLREL